jgi:hypothetical protein
MLVENVLTPICMWVLRCKKSIGLTTLNWKMTYERTGGNRCAFAGSHAISEFAFFYVVEIAGGGRTHQHELRPPCKIVW